MSPFAPSSSSDSHITLPPAFTTRFAFVDVPVLPPTRRSYPPPSACQTQVIISPRHLSTSRTQKQFKEISRDSQVQICRSRNPSRCHATSPTSPFPTSRHRRKKQRRLYDDPAPNLTLYPPSSFPPICDHLVSSDSNRRLDILICGLNPGLKSSQSGTHFAHPSNHFYKTLVNSGLTPVRVAPADCASLLDQESPLPSIGLTNICARPTAEGGELGRRDFQVGTPILGRKIRSVARPRLVVFAGKGIGKEWERCCREIAALQPKKRVSERGLARPELKGAVQQHLGHIELPFPAYVPWATDHPLGLGLMPFVLVNDTKSRQLEPSIKKEEGALTGETQPPSRSTAACQHSCYSFFFLTASPSGRVTTMGITEKSEWMRKGKDCVDFLISCEQQFERCRKVEEGEAASGEALVARGFEIINDLRFDDEQAVSFDSKLSDTPAAFVKQM